MRFRFVHAADLHLDTPFSGLGQLAPDLAARLRDASLTALDRVVAEALRVDAAFVVLAGDIYDGPDRGTRAQLHLRTALARLAREDIPTFIAHGNHDPEGGHYTAVRTWPEGVVRFAPGAPQRHPVTRAGAHLATVHGVSYATRHTPDNLALTFPRVDTPGFHVAVLHCNVGDHPGHANYAPCTLDDLRSRGMNYWALGHVHRHRVLARDPWVVYPGNTQGRSLAAGELGPKGAVVVEVEDDRVLDLRPFTTDSARFFDLSVPIDDTDDVGALVDRLRDRADALRDDHPDVALLLRATLTGRGPLHRDVKDLPRRQELLDSLGDGAAHDVWWLALEDAARPALDYAQLREGGDLRAAVLETADAWRAALPADLLDELRAAGGDLDPDVLRALLDAATHDVLDRLSPEPA